VLCDDTQHKKIVRDSITRPVTVRVVWTISIGMGSKLSSASDSETLAESTATGISGDSVSGLSRHQRRHHYHRHHTSGTRSRARSFGGVTQREAGATTSAALDIDVDGLLDLERPRSRSVIAAGSVPVRVFSFGIIVLFIQLLCRNTCTLVITCFIFIP